MAEDPPPNDERKLIAFLGEAFLDPMLVREPRSPLIEAMYVKRVIEIFGSPAEPETHAVYHFMVYRITIDGEVHDHMIETHLAGVILDDELKHAAQRIVASKGNKP